MKRVGTLMILLLLIAGICYAQVPRNPDDFGGNQTYDADKDGGQEENIGVSFGHRTYLASAATTSFGSINAVGLNATGNPGLLSLGGFDPSGSAFLYYLWVNQAGELMIASAPTLTRFSSFPTGDWRTMDDQHTGINTVGDQS